MIILGEEGASITSLFCDVDGTLVHHVEKNTPKKFTIDCPYTGEKVYLLPDEAHIRLLKRNKAQGSTIVVWSHGGVKWAKVVVEALDLTEYVDAIIPKLERYMDDNEFGPNGMQLIRIYMPNGWGKSLERKV